MPSGFEQRAADRPLAATVLGGLCSSAAAVFVALAAVSPGTAAWFRFAIAALILFPWAARSGGPGTLCRHLSTAKTLAAGACLGADALLWNQAIADSGAGIATVIVNAQVIVVPLLAWAAHGERPARLFFPAAAVMLGGVALAGGIASSGAVGPDPRSGAILAAGAALSYAAFLFLLREADESGDTVGGVFAMTVAAAIVSLVVAPFWGGLTPAPGLAALAWLIALALSSQVLAYLLIAAALPRLSASVGASVLLIQPLGSIALAAVVLGERPTILQLGGCALVLAAVYLVAVVTTRQTDVDAVGSD